MSFSRIKGQDDQGNDDLDKPKEIGAVWPWKSADKQGAILDLDIIPTELVSRRELIFLVPVDDKTGGAQMDTAELILHPSAYKQKRRLYFH